MDLRAVPYVGDQTAKDFKRAIKGSRPTGNIGKPVTAEEAVRRKYRAVLQAKLDARQRENLAKAVGRDENTFLTQQERTERNTRESTGPGENIRRGDFRVDRDIYAEATEMHRERPESAQEQDAQKRARVTTDFALWADDKNSYDFPGVDTPTRRPRREEKDRDFVDFDSLLRPFDDE